jgi:AcrR family transcriptional regulator
LKFKEDMENDLMAERSASIKQASSKSPRNVVNKRGAAGSLPVTAVQQPRRERKVQRTRRHIAEEAIRLFTHKGYAATTIEEIADAAAYSTSTFFRLFADKEEVIFYDFNERLDELKAAFTTPHADNAWVTIRRAFIQFAQQWDNEGEPARQRAELFHTEPTLKFRYLAKNDQWEQEIAKLIAMELSAGTDHGAHTNLKSNLIAGAAVSAFRAAWHTQQSTNDMTLSACVEQAFDHLENIDAFFRT